MYIVYILTEGLVLQVFGYVSLVFVVVSIISFLAETMSVFSYHTLTLNTTAVNANVSVHVTDNNDTLTGNATSNETGLHNNSSANDYQYITIDMKHPVLQAIDMTCMTYFILEYAVRLIFAPKKLKYVTSLLAVIDVLAILPDVIETVIYFSKPELRQEVDAVGYINAVRVIRVLRIFRLVRHSPGLWILIYTLRASFSELMLLVWFMGLGILVFSSLIYYVDDRDIFTSIPTGFWWALITMTTVGYVTLDARPNMSLSRLHNTLGKSSLCKP